MCIFVLNFFTTLYTLQAWRMMISRCLMEGNLHPAREDIIVVVVIVVIVVVVVITRL